MTIGDPVITSQQLISMITRVNQKYKQHYLDLFHTFLMGTHHRSTSCIRACHSIPTILRLIWSFLYRGHNAQCPCFGSTSCHHTWYQQALFHDTDG